MREKRDSTFFKQESQVRTDAGLKNEVSSWPHIKMVAFTFLHACAHI